MRREQNTCTAFIPPPRIPAQIEPMPASTLIANLSPNWSSQGCRAVGSAELWAELWMRLWLSPEFQKVPSSWQQGWGNRTSATTFSNHSCPHWWLALWNLCVRVHLFLSTHPGHWASWVPVSSTRLYCKPVETNWSVSRVTETLPETQESPAMCPFPREIRWTGSSVFIIRMVQISKDDHFVYCIFASAISVQTLQGAKASLN